MAKDIAKVESAKLTSVADDEIWDCHDPESKVTKYHLKRAKQKLELAKVEEELNARALKAAQDKLKLEHFEAILQGESGFGR